MHTCTAASFSAHCFPPFAYEVRPLTQTLLGWLELEVIYEVIYELSSLSRSGIRAWSYHVHKAANRPDHYRKRHLMHICGGRCILRQPSALHTANHCQSPCQFRSQLCCWGQKSIALFPAIIRLLNCRILHFANGNVPLPMPPIMPSNHPKHKPMPPLLWLRQLRGWRSSTLLLSFTSSVLPR